MHFSAGKKEKYIELKQVVLISPSQSNPSQPWPHCAAAWIFIIKGTRSQR